MKIVIAAIVFMFANVSLAKCINTRQEISGYTRTVAGNPIAGAEVAATWRENGKPVSTKTLSGSDGSYSLMVIFSTFSGETISGDICKGKLEEIKIVGSKEGFNSPSHDVAPLPSESGITLNIVMKQAKDG